MGAVNGDHLHHEEPLNGLNGDKKEAKKETTALESNSSMGGHQHLPLHLQNQMKNITATVEKKIRVAKAQAEIDRILNGPEAPFDAETELKKVASIAPPVADDETVSSSETAQLELEVSQLEDDLYKAVKQQDYAKAAAVKREISQLHLDDCAAVLQVNAAFYRAFSQKDYAQMEQIWLHDGTATCIHPSSKSLVGSKAVLNSWKRMFAAADGSFQRNWMEPADIRLSVKGASTAIITCDEHVYARRFVRGQKRQTELINKLTATNVFRKCNGQWKLCHHHASWHADSEAAKKALRGAGGSSSGSSSSPHMLLRQQARRDGYYNNNNDIDDNDGDPDNGIAMDGILGMTNFGPLLGNDGASGAGDEKRPVKRIVMAAGLQDLLNGNLGDLLGGGGAPGVSDGSSSQDSNSNDSTNGAVIHFSSADAELIDDNHDDDDHDVLGAGNDDDDDDDDETPTVSVSVIKQSWDNDHQNDSETGGSNNDSLSSSSSSSATGGTTSAAMGDVTSNSAAASAAAAAAAPKDALRQDCISALRKLAVQGSISPKQKRVLLTDIITCSAKGEFSMVEVAYELLCGEGDDQDAAEEEFADQCRVFSQSLPETPQPPMPSPPPQSSPPPPTTTTTN